MLAMNIVLSMLCAGIVIVAAPVLLLAVFDVAVDLYRDMRGNK